MDLSSRRPGPAQWDDAAALVGRNRELDRVREFLSASWPRILLLEGPAGIGKSTLLAVAASLARAHGARSIVARPSRAEADLPHAVLTSLLPDDLVADVGPALPPPRRRALEIALRRTSDEAGALDPAALGLAVLDVLSSVARPVPLLLVIDDLQWADVPSAAALAYAFRRAVDTPIGLLAAARTGIESTALDLVLDALPSDRRTHISVGALSIGAIGHLLEARTGRSRRRSVVARISDTAGGNPLLALELARAMDAAGHEPTAWEPLAIPPSADALIAGRLGRLAPAADDAVLAVALAGTMMTATLLEISGEAGRQGLEDALRAGLLELDADHLRLGHPLVGAAAIGRSSPARKREVHARLAATMTSPSARARHMALAADGPDPEAASACDDAAEDAATHGAGTVAAELAELAIGLTPAADGEAIAVRQRLAAERRLALGDAVATLEHLDAGLLAATGPATAVPLHIVGVELAYTTGGRRAAHAAAERALLAAGTDPVLRARSHAAMLSWVAEDTRAEREIAAVVLDLLAGRETEAPEAASDALAVLAEARLASGEGPAFDLLDRARTLDRQRPDLVVGSLNLLASTLRTVDRIDESRRAYADGLGRLERAGWESRRISDLAHAAWVEILAGDYRTADRLLGESLDLAAQLRLDATGARVYRAHLDVLLGRNSAAAVKSAEEGLTAARQAGDVWVAAMWRRTLGTAALLRGAPNESAEHLGSALETYLELGIREPNWPRLDADLVEALVTAGRLDDATAALDTFRSRAATARLPWSQVTAARAEALVLAARDKPEAALAVLDATAEASATLPLALDRYRTQMVRGSVLRRLRRIREARAALEEAAAGFAALPSDPWLSKARSELARLGGRVASGAALTPAELQVASLAAEGRSNREIAAALVVSVRTVESQLAAAYAKLGVRGRASLGVALGAERDQPA